MTSHSRWRGFWRPLERLLTRQFMSALQVSTIHVGWKDGVPTAGTRISAAQARSFPLAPKTITAFLAKLQSPIAVFEVQRTINGYKKDPLARHPPGSCSSTIVGADGSGRSATPSESNS